MVFLPLIQAPWYPQKFNCTGRVNKTLLKPVRKGPAFAITVPFVEPAYMVNEAESAHLGAYSFEGAVTDVVLVRDWL